jgi:CubicO group peptidase (beta-lactamase class C family)
MKIKTTSVRFILPLLALLSACQQQPSAPATTEAKSEEAKSTGNVIYAEPDKLSSNISLSRTLEISEYFNNPENLVKIQFPNEENQYAWVNISKFYHTGQVERSGEVSMLPYSSDESIGEIEYKNKNDEMVSVNQHFAAKPIDAMVVVKNGTIVYERYKTMGPDEKHLWFSCSKVTGSTMLALLEHEGKIDVKKYVSEYLPELKGSVWDGVTVEEAIDMANGLNGTEHDEEQQNSRTDPDQIWYRWAATDDIGVVMDVRGRNESWSDALKTMERKYPGHQSFEYNSINTFVMNKIVERVADAPLYKQMQERIWSKMGMEHDAFYMLSPSGRPLGFMGVNSTVRDMARFGMVFTPSGEKIAGEKIIPDAVMEKIYDRTYLDMYDKGFIGKKNSISFYDDAGKISNRYQWDAILSDGDLFKAGVGGQGIYISPKSDMVVAWFCTSDGNNQEETMARAIVKSLSRK